MQCLSHWDAYTLKESSVVPLQAKGRVKELLHSTAMFSSIKNTAGWLSKTSQAFVESPVEMPKMVADNWPLDVVLQDLCYVSGLFSFRLHITTICAKLEMICLVVLTV